MGFNEGSDMPYFKRTSSLETEPFVQAILSELAIEPHPYEETSLAFSEAPTIIEEDGYLGKVRSTVVWDTWGSFQPDRRARIVREAYRRHLGPGAENKLGLVTGLTWREFETQRAKGGHQASAPRQVAKGDVEI